VGVAVGRGRLVAVGGGLVLVGIGVDVGVLVGVGVDVGVLVAVGTGDGVQVDVAVKVADGVGVAVGVQVTIVAVGEGNTEPTCSGGKGFHRTSGLIKMDA
jgi:hypothetical protein